MTYPNLEEGSPLSRVDDLTAYELVRLKELADHKAYKIEKGINRMQNGYAEHHPFHAKQLAEMVFYQNLRDKLTRIQNAL